MEGASAPAADIGPLSMALDVSSAVVCLSCTCIVAWTRAHVCMGMQVCMYVNTRVLGYTIVRAVYMYSNTCVHYFNTRAFEYLRKCNGMHTYIHAYIHTYIPTYTHTHTYTRTYIHTHTYVYIHTHTHTHTHTYIHTHISMPTPMALSMILHMSLVCVEPLAVTLKHVGAEKHIFCERACMCVCTHVIMHVLVFSYLSYASLYMNVCIEYMCIYSCTYIYIYIYMLMKHMPCIV
jgi:hypothetical protein